MRFLRSKQALIREFPLDARMHRRKRGKRKANDKETTLLEKTTMVMAPTFSQDRLGTAQASI